VKDENGDLLADFHNVLNRRKKYFSQLLTDCNNCRGISLLSTSYTIFSNILFQRLSPYINEMIVDHHCGSPRNRSTTDRIFCIRQILEEKMRVQCDSTSAVHKLQESL
jgi:hypothetical protein